MGSFPLVELSDWVTSPDEIGCVGTPLPIKQWEKGSAYVAFSHVWIDGLGSDTERGLPSCQISALQGYAAKVAGTSLIWIDALCIPLDPSYRKKAIQMMFDIYKQSSTAIVLDAGLRSYNLSLESSAREVGIRLPTCVWMHRLCTLPECLLPPDVYIVFEREICSLEELLLKVLEDRQFPIEYTITRVLSTFMSFKGDKKIPLGAIQNVLSGRDTSKLDDETLAIGPLLDLSISKLLDLTGEERVAEFWSIVKVVNRLEVFLICPRLAKPGFRWAPKSMMSSQGSLSMDGLPEEQGWHSAIVTEKGLRGTYFTYLLRNGVGRPSITKPFALALDNNKTIFVHGGRAEEPIDWVIGVALTGVTIEDDVQVFRYGWKASMTLMMPNERDLWKARTFPASSG